MAKKNRKQRQLARNGSVTRNGDGRQAEDAREITQEVIAEITQMFAGPLPPPDVLEDYNRRFPGLAERIIRHFEAPIEMAQAQQAHRIELERIVIVGDSRRSWVGLFMGFAIAVTAVVCGTILILNNKPVEGLVAILAALGTLVGSFVYAHKKRSEEIRQNRPR